MRVMLVGLFVVLLSVPAVGQDLGSMLDPDAVVVAEPLDGQDSLSGASWEVASVYGHRLWVDLFRPLESWGGGMSADLAPGKAACVGGGYVDGWTVYVGAHIDF